MNKYSREQRRKRLQVMTLAFRYYRERDKYADTSDSALNILILSAARTVEQLEDGGSDIAIDIIRNVYYHVPFEKPRKDITAKMIYAAGNKIHKDIGVLWNNERYICDMFWKKYHRIRREQEKRRS